MNETSVAELLVRTNDLLSTLVRIELRDVLAAELADAKKRKLYELTDGDATSRELSRQTGMSLGAISRTWQAWDEAGLLVKRDGKYRRILG